MPTMNPTAETITTKAAARQASHLRLDALTAVRGESTGGR